ncbi:tRNA1(Val) (adenine(37)-N6)-methyltransferase [Jannaschia seohaensis]|uniref:tRNA1(Val) A37 N6-methylase TrmN6 n=1 Tax=Jannaschia seohaensis TaxID=475081 RepID=A0A2Y9AQC3_9RHOB|nr:methyltransferase [Jannaschia seohaensis]PWJ18156.1 tRNA1(Val) A37 N6-methylase TrmN6 [Jannaschia seohaensis]SSA46681.1 tRNA1(Val) A37 N6-methylase TrmN6 [Jannaschia seohaensis]
MSRDAFLGGRLHLEQLDGGFRAGSDAVLLAAAVPAVPGDRVLDLGCGVGAAMYCLGARVPGLDLTGVEWDAAAAALARRNGGAEVAEADVTDLPPPLRRQWTHVIANPPYFAAGAGSPARDPAREAALREAGTGALADWVRVACRRVAPKGTVTIIARADRLGEILPAMTSLGDLAVRPIAPLADAPAGRVVVQGRLGAKGPLELLPPLVLHRQRGDGAYAAEAEKILRGMEMLTMRRKPCRGAASKMRDSGAGGVI